MTPSLVKIRWPKKVKITAENYISEIHTHEGDYRIVLASGIFNPFGPTFNIYFVQAKGDRFVLRGLMLNPYKSEITDLYEIDPEVISREAILSDKGDALANIQSELVKKHLVEGKAHPAGTLQLPITGISERAHKTSLAEWLYYDEAASRDYADLQNPEKRDDPFARVDLTKINDRSYKQELIKLQKAFTPTDAVKLSGMLLTLDQRRIEFINIRAAWTGCSENFRKAELSETVMFVILLCTGVASLLTLTPDQSAETKEEAETEKEEQEDDETPLPDEVEEEFQEIEKMLSAAAKLAPDNTPFDKIPLYGNKQSCLEISSDPDRWDKLLANEMAAVLFHSLLEYGKTVDLELFEKLSSLYQQYIEATTGPDRLLLTRAITANIIQRNAGNEWRALMLIAISDDNASVVSTACLDIAMLHPQEDGDPLTGPKAVLYFVAGGLREKEGAERQTNEGAAFSGILLTGDSRLKPDLLKAWGRLSHEDKCYAAQQRSGLVTGLLVDFWVSRLCRTSRRDDVLFGLIAGLIADMPASTKRTNYRPAVLEITRNFGYVHGIEPMTITAEIGFSEYMERHRRKLQRSAARESEPRVIPDMMEMWGMECHENAPTKKPETNEKFALARMLPHKSVEVSEGNYLEVIGHANLRTVLVSGIFSPSAPIVNVYFLQTDVGRVILRHAMLSPYTSEISDMYEINPKFITVDTILNKKVDTLAAIQTELVTNHLNVERPHPAGTLHLPLSGISEKTQRKNLADLLLVDAAAFQDFTDFQIPLMRANPFMRNDRVRMPEQPCEHGVFKLPKEFRRNDALIFADILLTKEQRNVEFTNLLKAWAGPGELFEDQETRLSNTGLLSILQYLVPELPELLTVQDS